MNHAIAARSSRCTSSFLIGFESTIVLLYFIIDLSTMVMLLSTPTGSGTSEAAFSWPVTLLSSGLIVGFLTLLTLDREGDVGTPEDAEL